MSYCRIKPKTVRSTLLVTLVLALIAMVHPVQSMAQEIAPAKIAVLEMRVVERDAKVWIDLRTKFKKANDDVLAGLRKSQASLEEEGKALQQQQTILSSEAFNEKRTAFDAKVQELNKQAQERRQALEKALIEGRNEIVKAIREVVVKLAEEKGLNLIMDRSNNDPTIVLALPEIEITKLVIERLDKKIQSVAFSVAPPQ